MRPLAETSIPEWMYQAACAEVGGDLWYPEKGSNGVVIDRVRAICAACPVKSQCLDYAMSNVEIWGIFGGLTYKERQKLGREHRGAA